MVVPVFRAAAHAVTHRLPRGATPHACCIDKVIHVNRRAYHHHQGK
jgi:hypothetical protein